MAHTTLPLTLFLLLLLCCQKYVDGQQCCGGPRGCVTIPAYDADPPVPAAGDKNDCLLPNDPDLYYVPSTWVQQRPWSGLGPLVKNGTTSGWALDPRGGFGCMVGGWCPYACKSPLIESQFDDLIGQPWEWSRSCAGKNWLTGAGRRIRKCPTDPIPAQPSCAGGQNGLYCNAGGSVSLAAPSSQAPLNYQTACIPGANAVEILNDTPWKLTTCRTVFPGSEIPQIPTEVLPGEIIQLTSPIVQTSSGGPAWWTAGATTTVGLQFYFMRPQLPGKDCLDPICQWIMTRPGMTQSSQGGIDYTPYIIEWVPSSARNSFVISVRMNVDASVQPNSGYSGALGAPGYGLQLYDSDGNMKCDAWWTGPVAPPGATDNCATLCVGQGCANNQSCGSDCPQTLPDCTASGTQCATSPVEPHMNKGDGTPFATGAGLRDACSAGSWDIDNPGVKRIRIRLYPFCDGGPCPAAWGGNYTNVPSSTYIVGPSAGVTSGPPNTSNQPTTISGTSPVQSTSNGQSNAENIQTSTQSGGMPVATMAGIIVGGVLAVTLIVIVVVILVLKREKLKSYVSRPLPIASTPSTVQLMSDRQGSTTNLSQASLGSSQPSLVSLNSLQSSQASLSTQSSTPNISMNRISTPNLPHAYNAKPLPPPPKLQSKPSVLEVKIQTGNESTEWVPYQTKEGFTYYYNAATGESKWEL